MLGPEASAWAARVPINTNAMTIGSRASKATTRRPRTVSLRPALAGVVDLAGIADLTGAAELAGAADLAEDMERTAARCIGSAAVAVT